MKNLMTMLLVLAMLVSPVGGEDSIKIEVHGFQMGHTVYPGTTFEGKGQLGPEAASLGREELARRDRSLLGAYAEHAPSFGRAILPPPAQVVSVLVAVPVQMPPVFVLVETPVRACCANRAPVDFGNNYRGPYMRAGYGSNCRGMGYTPMRTASCCGGGGIVPLPACGYYCNCAGHMAYCRANGLLWTTTPCCCSR